LRATQGACPAAWTELNRGQQARHAGPALLDAIPADPAHPLQVCLLTATRRDHGFEKGALELRFAL
jgi:hypothetical protein